MHRYVPPVTFLVLAACSVASAQEPESLAEIPIEELLQIEVTSVSVGVRRNAYGQLIVRF